MKNNKRILLTKAAAIVSVIAFTAGAFTACTKSSGRKYKTHRKATATTAGTTDGTPDGTTDGTIEAGKDSEGWNIWERNEKGVEFLQISNSGIHGRHTAMDYLLFRVYNSEKDAKKAYEDLYREFKKFDKGRTWDEGENWFISEEPGVCDASITSMLYLEGNVIIWAEIDIRGCGETCETFETQETTETTVKVFDRSTLKDYILNNVPEIIRFVNEVILEK